LECRGGNRSTDSLRVEDLKAILTCRLGMKLVDVNKLKTPQLVSAADEKLREIYIPTTSDVTGSTGICLMKFFV
jgi:hypothetical protein